MRHFICLIIAFLTLLLPAFSAAQHPLNVEQQTQMTPEKWREDLKYFAAEMERVHKNAYHAVSKEEFRKAVAELDAQIPSLEGHQVVAGLMRLTAMIGDGHTGFRWGPIAANGIAPLGFYWFEDGIYVRSAAPQYADLIGAKLVAVGGVRIDEAIKKLEPLIWRDNSMGVRSAVPWYLTVPRILNAAGLSRSKEKASYQFEKAGKRFEREVEPAGKLDDLQNNPAEWVHAVANGQKPLWLRQPRNSYWYEVIPETKTLYIQFNEVQNKQEETIADFFGRVFALAEKEPVERVVLDMRMNGGGNNYLNIPIITGAIRSRLNVKGKLFVIIGRETFSAAQNTINDLEKYTNAIFVGEPTGASPNHFGDAVNVNLPNSKFVFRPSTVWWQDMDERDKRKWTAPDVAADLSFADYVAGRDPAMEAILAYKPAESMDDIIAWAQKNDDVPGLIERYRKFRSDPKHKYTETMTIINRVGHYLLRIRRPDDALTIFKVNAEDNPGSAIVYQSLGDVYDIKGDKENALANYKKAISIDPKLAASAEAIRRLNAQ